MIVGLRDFYPKFWMSGLAALAKKLGAVKPAGTYDSLANSLVGVGP